MILKGNSHNEWSRFGCMPGTNTWEKEEECFCCLLQSPFTQLPVLFSNQKDIGLNPSSPPSPWHTQVFHDAPVHTSTIPFSTHSLFKSQQCLAVGHQQDRKFSFCLAGFPQAVFYAWSAFSNLLATFDSFLQPCANVSASVLSSFTPPQIPFHLQSFSQQIWRFWVQFLLLHQLHAIAIICF